MTNDIWFQTLHSKIFKHHNPRDYQYDIREIIDVLSSKRRFGDHISADYKVAHHSLLVARLYYINSSMKDNISKYINCLYALLHDSQEAYYGDIVSPLRETIKNLKCGDEVMAQLNDLEEECFVEICKQLIFERFGTSLAWQHDLPTIKKCDTIALKIESDNFCGKKPQKWFCDDIIVHTKEQKAFENIWPSGNGLFSVESMFYWTYEQYIGLIKEEIAK